MCKKLNNKHALLQSLHLTSPAFALVTIFCLEGCLFGKSFRCHTKRSFILYTLTFENQRAKLWTRYLIKLSFSFFFIFLKKFFFITHGCRDVFNSMTPKGKTVCGFYLSVEKILI